MLATPTTFAPPTRNLIVDYHDVIAAAAQLCGVSAAGELGTPQFAPGFALPRLDDDVRRFFSAATAAWRELGEHRGHRMHMLDLTQNPGTRTTKTFAAMVIVARAVEFIRATGEPVCLFTPTSANKGIALRDAVGWAIAAGLVTPEQLSIVVLAPSSTRAKFRKDALAADPSLRKLNPLLSLDSAQPEAVKALGRAFVDAVALPDDPSQLREWSLVMALTGVLNAIDRGLVPDGKEIVIHGSGSYTAQDYAPLAPNAEVITAQDVASAIFGGR
jgi:hypothetical protein